MKVEVDPERQDCLQESVLKCDLQVARRREREWRERFDDGRGLLALSGTVHDLQANNRLWL